MKITKKLLEQYIREVMKEANYTQLELPMELPPKTKAVSQVEPASAAPVSQSASKAGTVKHLLNSYIRQHMKDEYLQALDLGPRELFRLYMLNSKWKDAWDMDPESTDIEGLPKITNVTKMQSGITDVEYSNGDVESHQPYGVDVNQMYVRRKRWR